MANEALTDERLAEIEASHEMATVATDNMGAAINYLDAIGAIEQLKNPAPNGSRFLVRHRPSSTGELYSDDRVIYAAYEVAEERCTRAIPELVSEIRRLRAELTQARNENLTLRARMGQIVDTATMPMPMPEYWHPRIG